MSADQATESSDDDQVTQSPDDLGRRAALLAEYAEVNSNFRLLTNIRFKLLAFLPLGPAATIIFTATTNDDAANAARQASIFGLCLFGLVVTIGLATYNARNDQIYLWHVDRAAAIERELGIPGGSFANRPNAWLDLGWGWRSWHVGHVSSVTVIYSASLALWTLAGTIAGAQFAVGSLPRWGYAAALLTAIGAVLAGRSYVSRRHSLRRETLRENSRIAIDEATRLGLGISQDPDLSACEDFIAACTVLIGGERDRAERKAEVEHRIRFYGKLTPAERASYVTDTPGIDTAEQYVGLIADLPPSWLIATPQRRVRLFPAHSPVDEPTTRQD